MEQINTILQSLEQNVADEINFIQDISTNEDVVPHCDEIKLLIASAVTELRLIFPYSWM